MFLREVLNYLEIRDSDGEKNIFLGTDWKTVGTAASGKVSTVRGNRIDAVSGSYYDKGNKLNI